MEKEEGGDQKVGTFPKVEREAEKPRAFQQGGFLGFKEGRGARGEV